MNQKGHALLAVLIIVVIAGYLLYSGKVNLPQKQVSQISSVNETSNLKTETQNNYSFDMSYPTALNFHTSDYDGIGGPVTVNGWTEQNNKFQIVIFSSKQGVKNMLEFNAKTLSEESITVAGIKVNKKIGQEIVSNKGTLVHIGPLQYKGLEYWLTYSSIDKESDAIGMKLFNQVVSSFKFE
ncbi:MAG: hypothetical protein Q7R49_00770 [Candidatus Daviesbacteria bacterium]|nr:hypothetical protein [Candidatus Daviesbacteria bacterium]